METVLVAGAVGLVCFLAGLALGGWTMQRVYGGFLDAQKLCAPGIAASHALRTLHFLRRQEAEAALDSAELQLDLALIDLARTLQEGRGDVDRLRVTLEKICSYRSEFPSPAVGRGSPLAPSITAALTVAQGLAGNSLYR